MSDEHERLSELLPWYVNATLDGPEAAQVERHLASCAECRKESARFQALAKGEDGWRPSPAHFARVMATIDAPSPWGRLASWFRQTPRPVRIAFALQGAALAALVAVMAVRQPQVYQTLSRAPSAASSRARLHVVFAEGITEEAMRRLLQATPATIVGGPSAEGVYTVELALPAADRERARELADRLAKDPKVRFAAPVAGP